MRYTAKKPMTTPIQTSIGYSVFKRTESKMEVKTKVKIVIDMTS